MFDIHWPCSLLSHLYFFDFNVHDVTPLSWSSGLCFSEYPEDTRTAELVANRDELSFKYLGAWKIPIMRCKINTLKFSYPTATYKIKYSCLMLLWSCSEPSFFRNELTFFLWGRARLRQGRHTSYREYLTSYKLRSLFFLLTSSLFGVMYLCIWTGWQLCFWTVWSDASNVLSCLELRYLASVAHLIFLLRLVFFLQVKRTLWRMPWCSCFILLYFGFQRNCLRA